MGGDAGLWVRHHDRQFQSRERVVLYTAALSCIDMTGFVAWSMLRLADESRLALRSTQAAIRILSPLEYLVQADAGFRLAKYFQDRQRSGKVCAEPNTSSGGKICRQISKEKERTKEKENTAVLTHLDSGDTQGFRLSSEFPNSEKFPVRSEARGPDKQTLDRVWSAISHDLRKLTRGEYISALSLRSLDRHELVFTYQGWLAESSIAQISLYLLQAAEMSRHRRGRAVRIVLERAPAGSEVSR